MKTSDLMNAINGQDPALIAASAPGAGRKRARTLRILLIAAVALLAAALTVVAVFASKAPEPGTPVVAVTTEETKEDEKTPVTETPVETKETEVMPTETAVEPTPTETLVEPTPTKTPVETVDPTKVPYEPRYEVPTEINNYTWIDICTKPIAIFKITEILDDKLDTADYFENEYAFGSFTKIRCEPVFTNGVVHYKMHNYTVSDALEMEDYCIFIKDDILEEYGVGDTFLVQFKAYSLAPHLCMFAYQSEDNCCCIPIVDGKLFIPNAHDATLFIDENTYYHLRLYTKEFNSTAFSTSNQALFKFWDESFIDYWYNQPEKEVMDRMPREMIGNGSTVDEIIEYVEWFMEIFSKSNNLEKSILLIRELLIK